MIRESALLLLPGYKGIGFLESLNTFFCLYNINLRDMPPPPFFFGYIYLPTKMEYRLSLGLMYAVIVQKFTNKIHFN